MKHLATPKKIELVICHDIPVVVSSCFIVVSLVYPPVLSLVEVCFSFWESRPCATNWRTFGKMKKEPRHPIQPLVISCVFADVFSLFQICEVQVIWYRYWYMFGSWLDSVLSFGLYWEVLCCPVYMFDIVWFGMGAERRHAREIFGNQEGTIARNSKIPMKKGIDLMGFKYVLVSTPTENHDPNWLL